MALGLRGVKSDYCCLFQQTEEEEATQHHEMLTYRTVSVNFSYPINCTMLNYVGRMLLGLRP